jgi:hypothetical protein
MMIFNMRDSLNRINRRKSRSRKLMGKGNRYLYRKESLTVGISKTERKTDRDI